MGPQVPRGRAALSIPEGATPLTPRFVLIDQDGRTCPKCNQRTWIKKRRQVQPDVEWFPYADATGEHWHYPAEILTEMECGRICKNRWTIVVKYRCWCGWEAKT